VDLQEQADLYDAVLQFVNSHPDISGVHFWFWNSNPNAGGQNDSGFTPQNKPAQNIMSNWFGSGNALGQPPSFSATAPDQLAKTGALIQLPVTISNSGGSAQDVIVDAEAYDASDTKIFQQFFEHQNIAGGSGQNYSSSWTPLTKAGIYSLKVGIFAAGWAKTLYWNNSAAKITATDSGNPPPPVMDIWWPTNGSNVSGTQPFKAMLNNIDVSQYTMYWQVDGGGLVLMPDNTADYPHKEFVADLSSWTWHGNGPYHLNFVAKDLNGNVIAQQAVDINVSH